MIDDFFDDPIDNNETKSIKSLSDNGIFKNNTSKEISDIVNQTRKLAIHNANKDLVSDKESEYTESFEETEKESDSHRKTSETRSTTSQISRSYSEKSKTKSSYSSEPHSKEQITSKSVSQQNNSVTPEETPSEKTGTAESGEELKDFSQEKSSNEKTLSDDEQTSQDISILSVNEKASHGLSWEVWFVQKYKTKAEKNKEELERFREIQKLEEQEREKAKRKKIQAQNELTKWIQRKRIEEQRKKIEKRKQEELKEEEEEKKRVQKEKIKRRAKVAYREWKEMKEREEEAELKLQHLTQVEARTKKSRQEAAALAYQRWQTTHPLRPRRYECHAFSGGRVVTYYDRGRAPEPSTVNPIPWRRC